MFLQKISYISWHTRVQSAFFFIPRSSFHCSCGFNCRMMRRSVNLLQVNDQQWSQLSLSPSSEFANPYRTLQALSGLCWILAVPSQNCNLRKRHYDSQQHCFVRHLGHQLCGCPWCSDVALDALCSPFSHQHTQMHQHKSGGAVAAQRINPPPTTLKHDPTLRWATVFSSVLQIVLNRTVVSYFRTVVNHAFPPRRRPSDVSSRPVHLPV